MAPSKLIPCTFTAWDDCVWTIRLMHGVGIATVDLMRLPERRDLLERGIRVMKPFSRSWNIEDSRQQQVALWDGLGTFDVRRLLSPGESKVFNRVVQEDIFGHRRRRYDPILYVVGSLLLIWFLFDVISKTMGGQNWLTRPMIIGGILGIAISLGIQVKMRRRTRSLCADSRYAQEIMRLDRCPACLHLIREIGPAADGCTVCPECGGAWRLNSGEG